MLSWILLIIILILLVIVGTWIAGHALGRGEELPPSDPDEVAQGNLAAIARGDLDAIRFEVVPRGYRPEQVEAVLDQLRDQLAPQSREERGRAMGEARPQPHPGA